MLYFTTMHRATLTNPRIHRALKIAVILHVNVKKKNNKQKNPQKTYKFLFNLFFKKNM